MHLVDVIARTDKWQLPGHDPSATLGASGGSGDRTSLRQLSPQNGNISEYGRRLSAICTSTSASQESGDETECAKSRDFQPFLGISWEAGPKARLAGWRRSADRARLQPDSLQTGSFSGNSPILGRQETRSEAKRPRVSGPSATIPYPFEQGIIPG
jgi:hypothetical protein